MFQIIVTFHVNSDVTASRKKYRVTEIGTFLESPAGQTHKTVKQQYKLRDNKVKNPFPLFQISLGIFLGTLQ